MDTILVHDGDKGIRESLRRAMRASAKSRAAIAEKLSERVGRRISAESLNKWASEDESARRLPADCILPLSEILEDDSLQRRILTPHMAECLRLGEWLLSSKWVIEKLNVQLPGRREVAGGKGTARAGRAPAELEKAVDATPRAEPNARKSGARRRNLRERPAVRPSQA